MLPIRFQDGFLSCWSVINHIGALITLDQDQNPSKNACLHAFRDRNELEIVSIMLG